ncbi:MAG: hypothetical protein C4319_05565 [Acidimicrobiia bacterium]
MRRVVCAFKPVEFVGRYRVLGRTTKQRLALVVGLLLVVTPAATLLKSEKLEALSISQGEFKLDVEIAMTSTAASGWRPEPGSSPALKLFVHNFGIPGRVQQCATDPDPFTCERDYMRSSAAKSNTITFVIEPGYSRTTDFEIASGTALPDGFVFAGRGGKPGDPSRNPINLSGNPDAGTATVRVCIDSWNGGIPEYTWNAQCTWAREQKTTDQFPLGGEGSCPGWVPGEGGITGTEPGEGPAHIVTITNDAGPYEVPGLGVHPKGRLYDRRRERWAYARWSVLACAGVNITNILGQQLGLGASVYLEAFVYRDDPYPGAYSLILYQGQDDRLGVPGDMDGDGQPDTYKTCGILLNPCISIYGVALSIDTFASSKRVATVPKVCGNYAYTVRAADDVTSPGHSYIEGSDRLATAGFPGCPAGMRGVVAGSNGRPLGGAIVRAFDASTGNYVNSGFGWDAVPCRGGQLPYDGPAGVPAGPEPGSYPSSWGCDTTIGNTGFGLQQTPGWGDGRWYIRTNTGSGNYKVLITSPPLDGNATRWAALAPPASGTNDWNTASVWTTSPGPVPAVVGDGGDLTSTLTAATPVQGQVLKDGAWVTGVDQASVALWDCSGQQFEATPTYVFSDGTFVVDTPTPNGPSAKGVKAKFEVRSAPGAPNLVGWYSGTAAPADNFASAACITPGTPLSTTNFTGQGFITGMVHNPDGSGLANAEVSLYRTSTGTLAYVTLTSSDGSWAASVPATVSSGETYKILVRPPAGSGLFNAWYNLKLSYTQADTYTSPSGVHHMFFANSDAITGYVKAQGTGPDMSEAADINKAVVYAYDANTSAFAGWAKTGVQDTGRYTLPLPPGTYKLLVHAPTVTRENAFWSGAWSFSEATAVAPPATANFSLRPAGLIVGSSPLGGTLVYAYTHDGSHFAGWTQVSGGTYSLKVPKTSDSGYQYKVRFLWPSGQGSCWFSNTASFGSALAVNSPASGVDDLGPPCGP